MAKFAQRLQAREMRQKGESIKEVARILSVSTSTVSRWCSDIILTSAQVSKLEARKITKGYKGRSLGARMQKERKQSEIDYLMRLGLKTTKNLNKKDLMMVGLGLYLGEGNKDDNRFQFTNSDPELVKLIVLWLRRSFGVNAGDIYCRVLINEAHRHRIGAVEKKWLDILGLDSSQMRRTTLVKSQSKKIYENSDKYLGTLALIVRRSSRLQRRILGLMHGLVYNLNATK